MDGTSVTTGTTNMHEAVKRPRGRWSPREDEKLRQLVEQYGPQNWNSISENWNSISENLEGRSVKSCRFRWFTHLNPCSEEGEERLLHSPRFGKRKFHNFISSKNGNEEITTSNFLTQPSTDEETADTFNSDLCKEIKDRVTGYGESSAGPQKFSKSEEPDESMQKNVQFIDFLGVGT